MVKTFALGSRAYRRNRAQVLFSDDFSALSLRNAQPAGANKIRNSALFGAALGSPGLPPENMAVHALDGLSSSVVGTGTVAPEGTAIRSVDLRFSGTSASSALQYVVLESPADDARAGDPLHPMRSGILASPGQTWVFSVWAALVGTAAGYSNTIIALEAYDIAGEWLGATFTGIALTSGLTRFATDPLTVPAGTRFLKVTLLVETAQGAVDFTLRLAGPDARQGTAAGTHVATTADSGTWNTRTEGGPEQVVRSQQQHFADTAARGTAMTGGANPFSVSAGVLSVTATATPVGAATPRPYVSGVLTTRGRFGFLYGYAEAALRFPAGQGLWPRFRLLPLEHTDEDDMAEIVVAEWPGGTDDDLYARVVSGTAPSETTTTRTTAATAAAMTGAMHLYGVLWTTASVQFYLDRAAFGAPVTTPADLKRTLYPWLGLAVGGDFPGAIVEAGQIPAVMRADGITVWDALPF